LKNLEGRRKNNLLVVVTFRETPLIETTISEVALIRKNK